jgi:hypothetical protein
LGVAHSPNYQKMKELLNSKKFVATMIATVTSIALRFGFEELQITEILTLISPLMVYIGAQGFADLGKEMNKD